MSYLEPVGLDNFYKKGYYFNIRMFLNNLHYGEFLKRALVFNGFGIFFLSCLVFP